MLPLLLGFTGAETAGEECIKLEVLYQALPRGVVPVENDESCGNELLPLKIILFHYFIYTLYSQGQLRATERTVKRWFKI